MKLPRQILQRITNISHDPGSKELIASLISSTNTKNTCEHKRHINFTSVVENSLDMVFQGNKIPVVSAAEVVIWPLEHRPAAPMYQHQNPSQTQRKT